MSYSQGSGLPSGHVQLRELGHKEGRAPKNWCLWTVVLEKTPESLLDSKEIKPVNLKGNQPWILIGRTDTEAQNPVFWSSDVNRWLIGKVPDAGKDYGQKKRAIKGWDGWMASPIIDMNLVKLQKIMRVRDPSMLQSVGLQRVGHEWMTEQHQIYHLSIYIFSSYT